MFPKKLDKTALIYQQQQISFIQLNRQIQSFAGLFHIQPGDRVIIFSHNRLEWVYLFYASWVKQGIVVPVDASTRADDLVAIVQDCQPAIVFCSHEEDETVRQAIEQFDNNILLLNIDELINSIVDDTQLIEEIWPQRPAEQTALILYTSGTTGKPKGVMLSYDNLQANLEVIQELNLITSRDRILSLLPFHHILPLTMTLVFPLKLGTTVVMVTSLERDDILQAMKQHQVTVMIGVPRLYERFAESIMAKVNSRWIGRTMFKLASKINRQAVSKKIFQQIHQAFGQQVRYYVTGGAKMDSDVARQLWTLGFKLLEGYGTTETAPLIAVNPLKKIKLGTVGQPVSVCQVKLQAGELLVKGRNVMQGYYQQPNATEQVLKHGWYHTGDMAEIDQAGYVTITGRKDELIVLPNGKNIAPEAIERAIQANQMLIKEVAVIMRQGQLTAIVYPELSAFNNIDQHAIQDKIKWEIIHPYNNRVANFKKILKVVISFEPLPRTRLGKLRRFLIKDLGQMTDTDAPIFEEPQDRVYQLLKEYLIGLRKMTVYPFHHLELDLGLDSLDFVELLSFIESSFGLRLSKEEINRFPDLKKLAGYLDKNKTQLETEQINWQQILQQAEPRAEAPTSQAVRFRKLAEYVFGHYFTVQCHGLQHIPQSPCIFACNHLSFLDAPLVASALPPAILEKTFFVAKQKFFFFRLANYLSGGKVILVPGDKDSRAVMLQAAAILKAGKNLLIFPEGTRSRNGRTGTFKKSFSILSRELNIPIVPVAVAGTFQAWRPGTLKLKRVPLQVEFEKAILPDGSDYQQLAKQVKTSIEAALTRQSKPSN